MEDIYNIKYEKNNKGKGFKLLEDFSIELTCWNLIFLDGIRLSCDHANIYIKNGEINIGAGFEWNISGPSFNSKPMKVASLVHDALYTLMNHRKLLPNLRKDFDCEIKKIYLACSDSDLKIVSSVKANVVWLATRLFGRLVSQASWRKRNMCNKAHYQ